MRIFIVAAVVLGLLELCDSDSTELLGRIERSLAAIDKEITSLNSRWQIHTHPNFLRSVSMSPTAWDVMRLKFQAKILDASASGKHSRFVIGFMGSSVTAGHDSAFNDSFPVLTGLLMQPALIPLGIEVESRNAAMGNNPCVPYDLCPRTYAGPDSDIVHWEQSFNCFGSDPEKRDVFEAFLRQSIAIPSNPVVVFTSSDTPNWPKKDCDGKDPESKPTQSPEEKKALEYLKNGKGKLIATEINKAGPAMKSWGAMLELFRQYQTRAGVQLWDHTSYASYKCTGPYIAEWHNSGVASWHPSKLGHELRAAHYAYFWLLILQDAVVDLKNNLTGSAAKSIIAVTAGVKKHIELERKHIPPKPVYAGAFYTYPDSMQCLTTYEPKHDPDADLRRWVVGGLAGQGTAGGKAWTPKIFEEMTDPGIIAKARSRGYRDFKHMLYGNKNSAPLSIKINIGKAMSGTGFLCQPPGNWGKLPRGFKNFWEVGTEVYLTADTKDPTTEQPFEFSPSGPRTTKLAYTNRRPKDTQTICVDFAPFQFPAGQHILTIVAKAEENIMISTLLLPSK